MFFSKKKKKIRITKLIHPKGRLKTKVIHPKGWLETKLRKKIESDIN